MVVLLLMDTFRGQVVWGDGAKSYLKLLPWCPLKCPKGNLYFLIKEKRIVLKGMKRPTFTYEALLLLVEHGGWLPMWDRSLSII